MSYQIMEVKLNNKKHPLSGGVFWMLILSVAKARRAEVGLGWGVDLRASINELSRGLEVFERR